MLHPAAGATGANTSSTVYPHSLVQSLPWQVYPRRYLLHHVVYLHVVSPATVPSLCFKGTCLSSLLEYFSRLFSTSLLLAYQHQQHSSKLSLIVSCLLLNLLEAIIFSILRTMRSAFLPALETYYLLPLSIY